ncbi:MAG TPA: CHY zinc finger protein [Acidobacteriaceae bacterium]|nr:CHY zinc finger protein [Acidobacteriaceae bacterium]
MVESRPAVRGVGLDPQSRCIHYNAALDIIAIKMKCCGTYYACKDCHQALAQHPIEVWPQDEWSRAAVLCGACGHEMTIKQYFSCANHCPSCGSPFNPGCRNHYHFYFQAA